MSAEENKGAVHRYVEDPLAEVRSANMAATHDFLTSDAAFYDREQPPSVGTKAQKQRFVMLRSAFPNARSAIENRLAEEERVGSVGPCAALVKAAS